MNPFVQRINQSWVWPVSGMCVLLGFMVALAWVNNQNRPSRLSLLGPDQRERVALTGAVDDENFQKLVTELEKLRMEKTELESALANSGKEAEVLNRSLQDLKMFAGMTKVEGPGVVVTLRDSSKEVDPGSPFINDATIHYEDVLKTVNELLSAGAEAVSVNGHRISALSSIRCVGPTILVNDIKIAPPVIIRAIGEPDTLFGGMSLPGGVLSSIRETDAAMVQLEKVKMQELSPYIGTTTIRFLKVPEEQKTP
jgi:uncharacterized protein YlxW (UPF0749 family)